MAEEIKEIINKMIAEEPDSMIAEGDQLTWLINQLANWPVRVNEKYTTNIRFLMQSAARTIAHMVETNETDQEAKASDLS